MPTEQIETLIIGGGQAGLAMSHRLQAARARAPRAGAGSHRRALAQRALGRPEIPVSELVGAAAGIPVSAQRSRRLRRAAATLSEFIAAYAAFVAAADPLRRRGDARCDAAMARAASSPKPLTDRSRPTMSWSPPVPISAAYSGPAARRPVFQLHASRLPESRPASAGRGAGGRLRRLRRADCRGIAAVPAAGSISRSGGIAACRAGTAAAT